jgi:hypothetical protein
MMMPPLLRKTVLVTHVATSVGWLGALLGYLALDITVATSADIGTVRGAYIGMSLLIRYAIVPLALATVVIGIINALGTPWGLFRHYWVLAKLILTLIAAGVLLTKPQEVSYLATAAQALDDPRQLSDTLAHSIGGLIILITTLILSVFKPRGVTRYGWRKQRQAQAARLAPDVPASANHAA